MVYIYIYLHLLFMVYVGKRTIYIPSWCFQPHLKNTSQIGNLPHVGLNIKDIWNHHLDYIYGIHSRKATVKRPCFCQSRKLSTVWLMIVIVLVGLIQTITPGSMYGILTYISHKNWPNVGKYTIHGWYGLGNWFQTPTFWFIEGPRIPFIRAYKTPVSHIIFGQFKVGLSSSHLCTGLWAHFVWLKFTQMVFTPLKGLPSPHGKATPRRVLVKLGV